LPSHQSSSCSWNLLPFQKESQISIGHPSTTAHCEIRIPPYITKSYQKTSHKRNSYADNLQVNSNPRSCYCECFTNTLIRISSHFMLLGTTRFFLVAFSPIFIPSHYCWKSDENLILPEFFQPFLSLLR